MQRLRHSWKLLAVSSASPFVVAWVERKVCGHTILFSESYRLFLDIAIDTDNVLHMLLHYGWCDFAVVRLRWISDLISPFLFHHQCDLVIAGSSSDLRRQCRPELLYRCKSSVRLLCAIKYVGTDPIIGMRHVGIDACCATLKLDKVAWVWLWLGRKSLQQDLTVLMLIQCASWGLSMRRWGIMDDGLIFEANTSWAILQVDKFAVTLAIHF